MLLLDCTRISSNIGGVTIVVAINSPTGSPTHPNDYVASYPEFDLDTVILIYY